MAEIRRYLLPQTLQEIAEIATPEIAVAIARQWGGKKLYFPRTLASTHPLAKLIGRKAALVLCHHFATLEIEIPAARTYLRWHEARRLKAEGKSHAEIAEALKIGTRWVGKLLQGFDEGGEAAAAFAEPAHSQVCPLCSHKRRAPAPRTPDPRQLVLPLMRVLTNSTPRPRRPQSG